MRLMCVMRWLVALACLFAPSLSSADATSDTRDAMHDYFDGEKRGGYILIGMGAVGLAAGGLLYRQGTQTARGASYPLLGIGVLHVAAGIYINIASANRVEQFDTQITQDRVAFVAAEQTRMAGVSKQFTALKIAELVLATGGLTMTGIGWRTDRPRLKGAGLALAAEMMLTFGFDIFAANRAHDYRDRLAQVSMGTTMDPLTHAPTYYVMWSGELQ